MKKTIKILVMTLIVTSLMGMMAFAAPAGSTNKEGKPILDDSVRVRIEALKAEGKTREEVGTILKAVGFELPQRSGHHKGHDKMDNVKKGNEL